jgi:hypothetical protein
MGEFKYLVESRTNLKTGMECTVEETARRTRVKNGMVVRIVSEARHDLEGAMQRASVLND